MEKQQKMYTFFFRTLMYNKLGVDAPDYDSAYKWARNAGHTIEAYKGCEEIIPLNGPRKVEF
ncbi:hypothetical protein [Fictibacillus sp. NRS-1165]|uniref:hypothetical protein n=1 Tax=Fictibacillus sp. NRS-1165 TaxID=3144463 RepID=UPI003D1D6B76